MKKDRNTFFQESSYLNQQGFNPNMAMPSPNFTTSYANQGFYTGAMPNPNLNYNPNIPQNTTPDYSDIESRLSKLERQINRLDLRLNKLESNGFYSTEDLDNTTNVYMV